MEGLAKGLLKLWGGSCFSDLQTWSSHIPSSWWINEHSFCFQNWNIHLDHTRETILYINYFYTSFYTCTPHFMKWHFALRDASFNFCFVDILSGLLSSLKHHLNATIDTSKRDFFQSHIYTQVKNQILSKGHIIKKKKNSRMSVPTSHLVPRRTCLRTF